MKVGYKKLTEKAKLPSKATEGAAAYDLYAVENVYIPHGETAVVSTGIALSIPEGWKGEVYSRSGLASKGIFVANSPGKIDSDYRGEIKVILHNTRREIVGIHAGERIAQFEINPVYTIDWEPQDVDVDETERGDGGFGSTGN
jgi:dUTP pyrophosphatase